jgi:hypothetical protein
MRLRRLPEVHLAIIEERKVSQYLLAMDHPAGHGKAALSRRFGFRAAAWQDLRDAWLEHARSTRVVSISESEFGKKYIPEEPLTAPDARRPRVRAIWFIATGEATPRLVTAYAVPGVKRWSRNWIPLF